MSPEELRIGNFISIANDPSPPLGVVRAILPEEIQYNLPGTIEVHTCPIDQVRGIYVTPAWLTKLGLIKTKDPNKFGYKVGDAGFIFTYTKIKECCYIQFKNKEMITYLPYELRYVHQIQNFIYAVSKQTM
jgi:hypothetical protein